MWMGCNSWSSPEKKVLPWEGGWLDWDLHDSKGYQWLEDLVEEIREQNEMAATQRERLREQAQGFFGNVQ